MEGLRQRRWLSRRLMPRLERPLWIRWTAGPTRHRRTRCRCRHLASVSEQWFLVVCLMRTLV
jgi:hypothetical protein